ncbi:hypothetical protein LGQ02_09000 [Bacillus shivajii]|uniref:hypothetical protein n=1 Tax=Bacillus shivajii TaxID=1983719 RepID=UPI001CFA47DC|nr:hypothetical protein [Bacillus shivajii]UCZ54861.1 hypothetical protein LGQ02_09000 [Bacillus shivajii]
MKQLIYFFIILSFMGIIIGCSQSKQNAMEFDEDLLESKFDNFRDNIEKFDYEEVDRLHAELSEILEENKQVEGRNTLKNYLNSLYQAKEDGLM